MQQYIENLRIISFTFVKQFIIITDIFLIEKKRKVMVWGWDLLL